MDLPMTFAKLSAADWSRIRDYSKRLDKGDEEAFSTSAGYIDIGKTDGGAVYVAANSFDARGRDLTYRKLYQMQWPKGEGGAPAAELRDRNGRSLHGLSWAEWARIRETAARLDRDGSRESEFVYTTARGNVDVSPSWVKWEGGPKAGLPYSQWPQPQPSAAPWKGRR